MNRIEQNQMNIRTRNFFLPSIINFLILTVIMNCTSTNNAEKDQVQTFSHQLEILSGEKWWAGVISDSHLFPLSGNTNYQFDFYGNTAGNQGQPLLISNMGRYIWNEQPFQFRVSGDKIEFSSKLAEFSFGQSGNTLKEVFQYCSQHFFSPSGKIPAEELFAFAQFNTWIEFTYHQNQEGILDYARQIIKNGFQPGVLMIDEGWFKSYGDWDFDRTRFPDPEGMMHELKALNFKVILWVCPYLTPDGPFWKDLWLNYSEKGDTIWILSMENPEFPAVMQWWDGFSNVIDLSHPNGAKWFRGKLDWLVNTYQVDGFKFDGGDAVHYSEERFLTTTQSYDPGITPNKHSELFVKVGLDYPFNEYRAAWKMGGQPIAMRLRDKNHSWEDLQKLIPGIINQGLMGYAYTCPDLIGGGEYLSFQNLDSIDQELVVRAAQCHALMPMMQFSVAPWRVLNKENLKICVDMANLHVSLQEEILQLALESAKTGEPIIRALEYEFPGNEYAGINDQFMLGKNILVAPVVEKGARKRTVIFPAGRWEGDDGSMVEGPQTLEIETPLRRLPWYRKSE
jgi:alpha-glucosidase (family GH31 glycosyl hydrolase)